MDGWMDGWMDGRKSRFKNYLQQSKIEFNFHTYIFVCGSATLGLINGKMIKLKDDLIQF